MRPQHNKGLSVTSKPIKKEKEKKKMGRPTIFNQALADRICHLIATHSFGLKKLCETYPEIPDADTIRRWCREKDNFYAQYAQAKRDQADLMAEEILQIADDGQNDWMETLSEEEQGLGWRMNGEHVQRSRLRIDARKWLASKLAPKIYGTNNDDDKNSGNKSLLEQLADKLVK